jgi:hypothetical protein
MIYVVYNPSFASQTDVMLKWYYAQEFLQLELRPEFDASFGTFESAM